MSSASRAGELKLAVEKGFADGSSVSIDQLKELCGNDIVGRIIHSKDGFERINASQEFPFVMAPEALASALANPTTDSVLKAVGVGKKDGVLWRVLIIPLTDEVPAYATTWSGLMTACNEGGFIYEFPEHGNAVAAKLLPHLSSLKALYEDAEEGIAPIETFDKFVKSLPEPFCSEGIDGPGSRFDTRKKDETQKADQAATAAARQVVATFTGYAVSAPPDLAHARAFLRHALNCNRNFSGDGYSWWNADRNGKEMFVKNRDVTEADIPGHQWIDLPTDT